MNGKLLSVLLHAQNVQVCLDKLLRFRVLTCRILTVPPQLRQIEAELSKCDMLALQNATVWLKRVTTRKKFAVRGSSKMVVMQLFQPLLPGPVFSLWKAFIPTWNQRKSRIPLHSTHCFAWFSIVYGKTCFWVCFSVCSSYNVVLIIFGSVKTVWIVSLWYWLGPHGVMRVLGVLPIFIAISNSDNN